RTYEIWLVTPAFVAGADQQVPELRAPSIRGCLRWWFRLARKGAGVSPQQVADAEAEMFGSTDTGQRLILRTRELAEGRKEPLDYRALGFDHQYLWFPLRPAKGADRPIARPEVPAGTVIKVDTILPPAVGNTEEVFRRLDEVVCHWVLFGGIGMRSRRCAGSLWFASQLPSGKPLPSGQNAIERVLEDAQTSLRNVIAFKLSPKPFARWRDAVADAGNHYRGQRRKWRDGAGPARGRKALPAFGWPIMNFGGGIEVDGLEAERLASPLLLKVVPDGNAFRWLLVVVKEPFVDAIVSSAGQVRAAEVLRDFMDGFESASGPQPPGRGPSKPGRR
ncbi:MAG: type III-B CRISPR module RAMP protein Cmr1, partial [Candidatus Rokuibacteriota bacterium]